MLGQARTGPHQPEPPPRHLGTICRLVLPGWTPTRLNELIGKHWGKIIRRKKADYAVIAANALEQQVSKASGPRQVRMVVTLGPRTRTPDGDSLWKVVLDGLVHCGLLVNDNPKYCTLMPVEFERGLTKQTVIELTEV
jgi:hypothetical protein